MDLTAVQRVWEMRRSGTRQVHYLAVARRLPVRPRPGVLDGQKAGARGGTPTLWLLAI
jgi:hypothetical protein